MTNTIPNVPRELTIERDVFGAMHIKLGDFDFIQIQYQYPYTDNASTKALAERIAALLSAPSPAGVDAGIVDMYRHLQKVTPYRFKKIQDASITDGGDVMYFHKDRFDAALLADMAARCAAKGVV